MALALHANRQGRGRAHDTKNCVRAIDKREDEMGDSEMVKDMKTILEDIEIAAKYDSMPHNFYTYSLAQMMVLLATVLEEKREDSPND